MNKKYLIALFDAIVVMIIAVISIVVAYFLMKEDPISVILFQGLLIWLLTTLSQFYKEIKKHEKNDDNDNQNEDDKNVKNKVKYNDKNDTSYNNANLNEKHNKKSQENIKIICFNNKYRIFHYFNPFL